MRVGERRYVFASSAAVLLAAFSTHPATALAGRDGKWTVESVSTPALTPRRDYAVALDGARYRALYFGGLDSTGALNETWTLDLAAAPTWTQLAPGGEAPNPRYGASGIYDAVGDRFIVFGGYDAGFVTYRNDVSALSLAPSPMWSTLSPAGLKPDERMYQSSIYDPSRNRMIVFGGLPGPLDDLWELSLGASPAWNPLLPAGMPPSPRWGQAAVYDPVRDRMLVFGGEDEIGVRLNDVWAVNLSGPPAWSRVLVSGAAPSGRRNFDMIYEPLFDRLVLFGGYGQNGAFLADVWELPLAGPAVWHQLSPSGVGPGGLDLITAIFDPSHLRMVQFGGWTGGSFTNDTWFLTWDAPPLYGVEGPGEAAFSLAGLARNPSRTNLAIRFSLPDAAPARLEAMDVAGRAVFRGEVGSLGAGSHVVDAGRVAPGLYWIRLARGEKVLTARGAVVR